MQKEVKDAQKKVQAEVARMKKTMEATAKKAEDYVKKNPAKAAAISAGIGAALGAAAAMLMKGGKKKK